MRCAVQEPEEDIVSRAARGCDPSNEEECIITPRQVVNGLELPSFEDVSTAHFRIRSGVVRTRCTHSRTLSALTGMKIYLKHEWEQATGSFKERGARNSLLALDPEQKKKGVVAASAGNHALALAYHGRELGIPVTVLMPSIAPLTKITKCRALEANVVLEGDTIADAALAADLDLAAVAGAPVAWAKTLGAGVAGALTGDVAKELGVYTLKTLIAWGVPAAVVGLAAFFAFASSRKAKEASPSGEPGANPTGMGMGSSPFGALFAGAGQNAGQEPSPFVIKRLNDKLDSYKYAFQSATVSAETSSAARRGTVRSQST